MRAASRWISFVVAILVVGCGPSPRDRDTGGGDAGDGDGPQIGDCVDGTEIGVNLDLVYTIDQHNYKLSTFDPPSKTFTDLGALSCPTTLGGTPFSMSVDRTGIAWVLYNSGELFHVNIKTLTCGKTPWNSPNGLKVFGMGFSTDEPGGFTETLFVGGGLMQVQPSYTLAKVSPATMVATPISMEYQLPEMTGNGNAELWGFFADAAMPRVVQFDKTTGTFLKDFPQPTLAGGMAGYAFAHWGGDYWVFLVKNSESWTSVYQIDGMTGAIKGTTPTNGRTIVGAGVSTCAPTVIY